MIFIANNASSIEKEFDALLENKAIHNQKFLDMVTTGFTYDNLNQTDIDDIIHEITIMSCAGLVKYRLVFLLNSQCTSEKVLIDEIKKVY